MKHKFTKFASATVITAMVMTTLVQPVAMAATDSQSATTAVTPAQTSAPASAATLSGPFTNASPLVNTFKGLQTKNALPVAFTNIPDGAIEVKPDTMFKVQLDQSSHKFHEFDHKFQKGQLYVLVATDKGVSVYDTSTGVSYDPSTQTVSFTPPSNYDRYTTYGIIVTDHVPQDIFNGGEQSNDIGFGKLTTYMPGLPVAASQNGVATALPSAADKQVMAADDPTLADVGPNGEKPTVIGSLPKQAMQVAKDADTDHQDHAGLVEAVAQNHMVLFGGVSFNLGQDVQVHIPGNPNATVGDIAPGALVHLKSDANGTVTQIDVADQNNIYASVFTTGSAIGEPTNATFGTPNDSPRVTDADGGVITINETDDYGDVASGSTGHVTLSAVRDGDTLSNTATVQSDFTTDKSGTTTLNVHDHKSQEVNATISLDGPYNDGKDTHAGQVMFKFRPGLPSQATLTAPEKLKVAHTTTLTGTVQDVYGNAVDTGTEVDLTNSTSGAALDNVVYTDANGNYSANYTSPTKVQVEHLGLKTAVGTATASANIQLIPDDPYFLSMHSDQTQVLTSADPGKNIANLTGTVTDKYLNVNYDSTVSFSTDLGAVANAQVVTDANGQFTNQFIAGVNAGTAHIVAQDGAAQNSVAIDVKYPAGGYNSKGQYVQVATATASGNTQSVVVGQQAAMTVQFKDAAGEPLSGVTPTSVTLSGGTVNSFTTSDSNGNSTIKFTLPTAGTYTMTVAVNNFVNTYRVVAASATKTVSTYNVQWNWHQTSVASDHVSGYFSVAGRILNSDGTPAANQRFRLASSTGQVAFTTTDANGYMNATVNATVYTWQASSSYGSSTKYYYSNQYVSIQPMDASGNVLYSQGVNRYDAVNWHYTTPSYSYGGGYGGYYGGYYGGGYSSYHPYTPPTSSGYSFYWNGIWVHVA